MHTIPTELAADTQSVSFPNNDSGIEAWTPKRRSFLRMLGYGAGAAALGPLVSACGGSDAVGATTAEELRQQLLRDAAFWENVENMFALNPTKTFMNIGTAGSMPKVTLDFIDDKNFEKARDSLNGYGNYVEEREYLGGVFGVGYDELAISANTTSGMCHAILGLAWQPGDVIVTTNHEHAGGLVPMRIAAARYGVDLSMIEMPTGNDQTAGLYQQLFDDRIRDLKGQGKRVRAMAWSSPTYKTGTLLPIAELMQVVKAHGLISIVDGAHLPGMMDIDYGALGMDFMSSAGHKWQCGPGSTGFLVMRNKIRNSNPLPLPEWYPIHTMSFTDERARTTNGAETYDIAAEVTNVGSRNSPAIAGLVRSCQLWDEIGRERIQTYVTTLSAYLKEKIVERWGEGSLYSPKDDPKLTCALTSFNPFRNPDDVMNREKSNQFVSRLASEYQPAYIVRNVNFPVIGAPAEHYGIRISTHLWSDADQVDGLVNAMWDLAGKMG